MRRPWATWGLAALLVVVGVAHVAEPRPFDAIMPRAVPEAARRPLTYASGAVEVVAGTLLAVPRTRRAGGLLAFWLLLAVWPANISAALRGGYAAFPGWFGSATAAWLRVPLQLPLLWVAWRAARTTASSEPD